MAVNFNYKIEIILLIILLFLLLILKLKLKIHNVKILFFIIAYMYVIYIIYKTQFPIYIDNPFMEEAWGGIRIGKNVNLIPFHNICNKTSMLNICFFVPFGFILGFITKNTFKKTLIISSIFSFLIELSQILVNIFIGINFRYADINDIICNTTGAIIGYIIFLLFVRLVKMVYKDNDSKIINYIKSLA